MTTPHKVQQRVAQLEADGWDGVVCGDSQTLLPDPYVLLSAAASATDTLGLGTGVTNPCSRHPLVTANAIASLQFLSRGRAVLGVGRGDSALAFLGRGPVPVPDFESALGDLQRYLSGRAVPLEAGASDSGGMFTSGPSEARLVWLGSEEPKVPLDVAASGPATIRAAARNADRVSLTVGAALERLGVAMRIARDAHARSTRAKQPLTIGAYLNVAVHPDRATARSLAAGYVATYARFARSWRVGEPSEYDMTRHGLGGTAQTEALTEEFIDQFAVIGSVDECVNQLVGIARLGLSHLVLTPPGNPGLTEAQVARRLLSTEVIPAVRAQMAADRDLHAPAGSATCTTR